jgi:hypothetical protein
MIASICNYVKFSSNRFENHFQKIFKINIMIMMIIIGVLPLHIKVMLRKFIMQEKFFTLDQFNKKLSNFLFGVCGIKNRPSLIKNVNTGDHHLRQSGTCNLMNWYTYSRSLCDLNFGLQCLKIEVKVTA